MRVNNHSVSALLDSGAGVTVFPASLVYPSQIRPTTERVTAANGSRISVLGEARVMVHIGPDKFIADCLISDRINLPLLGFDWMSKNDVYWMFGSGEVRI